MNTSTGSLTVEAYDSLVRVTHIGMFVLLGLWAIYRVARGWLRLKNHQPMPMD